MLKKIIRNPWLFFLPALTYYVVLICFNKWPTLYGDEIRYADFAWNIIHGYYSPPAPHIDLWNGPGYPLLIVPFMALKIHSLYITLINALFQYMAVVFLYKTILKLSHNQKTAFIFSIPLAIYPNALAVLPILYTEPLTVFLISTFAYLITLTYTRKKGKYAIIAGLILGYLALTKIIFGYVILLGLAACFAALLVSKKKVDLLISARIFAIAFITTIPYLFYTYHLTGKVLYWGNSGGMSLYWMSTPYPNEYGDWKVPELSNNQYPLLIKSPEGAAFLKKNHATDINFILKHNEVEQDALFKQMAIRNIKQHPLKFAQNYYYNISRMLFNFPYTYSYQDGAIVGNIIRGSLILWASVAGIVLTLVNLKRVPYPVKLLLFFSGTYLALSAGVSAYPRQLDVMLPVLLCWLGYLASNLQKPILKFTSAENLDNISLPEMAGINVPAAKENTIN